MKRGTAPALEDGWRWIFQIELDCVRDAERDYPDVATAAYTIADHASEQPEDKSASSAQPRPDEVATTDLAQAGHAKDSD